MADGPECLVSPQEPGPVARQRRERSSEADRRESGKRSPCAKKHLDSGVSVYEAGIARTTVTLDDDVYQTAMHLSRSSGERLGKVLSGLARRGPVPRPVPPKRSSRRFPAFEVPPGSPMIPASRIERVIDEEGLF